MTDDLGKAVAHEVARGAADDGGDQDLGQHHARDLSVARTDRLHQADLVAALHDGSGDEVGDTERRAEQGKDRDQDHQQLCFLHDIALAVLPHGSGNRIGDDLLDLVADRADVSGTIPRFVFLRRQRSGALLCCLNGKLIIRRRQRGDLDGIELSLFGR